MLQIIVWMLCAYFVVKGFEIVSDPAQRNVYGSIGAILAFLAAPVFFYLSIEQVRQVPEIPTTFGTTNDAVVATTSRDNENVEASADRALMEAQQAVQNADAALNTASARTK